MLKIKLTPTGKKNFKQYRIVVTEERGKLTGKIIQHLGHYNPHSEADQIKINKELYQSWLKKGAKPTQTVKNLVAKIK